MTGAPPRATTTAGWRVRSEQATLALVSAVAVGLIAGVIAGLHGRGDVAVQVATAKAAAGGAEVVPAPAVVIDPQINRAVVFVVVHGHAVRQPVTAAPPPPGSTTVTVLTGLSPGAVVVVTPPQTLHDGSGVSTTPYSAPAPSTP